MSQFIHLLELVTAVLFVLLGRQLFSCYRLEMELQIEASGSKETAKNKLLSEDVAEATLDSVVTVAPVQIKQKAANSPQAPLPESNAPEATAAASGDILTDYIGGFFESPKPGAVDISEFKAPIPEKVVAPVVTGVSAEEELDDTIITVAEEAVATGANKMSEKVVHAMLDEAKLVYNS